MENMFCFLGLGSFYHLLELAMRLSQAVHIPSQSLLALRAQVFFVFVVYIRLNSFDSIVLCALSRDTFLCLKVSRPRLETIS
jgi:hypothetical protein